MMMAPPPNEATVSGMGTMWLLVPPTARKESAAEKGGGSSIIGIGGLETEMT